MIALTCAKFPPLAPGQQAVVVGAARSGLAAARLLGRMGQKVRIVDLKDPAPDVAAE